MNLYEAELLKFTESFEHRKIFDGTVYIPLGENNLKLEMPHRHEYDAKRDTLEMTIVSKSKGVLDSTEFTFESVWGMQEHEVLDNPNTYSPHLWQAYGKVKWNDHPPSEEQIKMIESKIQGYAELFMEQEQNYAMDNQCNSSIGVN